MDHLLMVYFLLQPVMLHSQPIAIAIGPVALPLENPPPDTASSWVTLLSPGNQRNRVWWLVLQPKQNIAQWP